MEQDGSSVSSKKKKKIIKFPHVYVDSESIIGLLIQRLFFWKVTVVIASQTSKQVNWKRDCLLTLQCDNIYYQALNHSEQQSRDIKTRLLMSFQWFDGATEI